eukprot:CAMPEP_0178933568 /NCGR_PEP_ID=MMETSP0786-20121207/23347_1 /TAXON_ID=186022 /ORGANISM="Thalassionema frauenfeldii, Strain CCMP 1798" /LENGTH=285 /DNA_ID=CAMNT_0020611189 /DNA_START=98 /DNA_END=955 /DNA_ORIENTATION=+
MWTIPILILLLAVFTQIATSHFSNPRVVSVHRLKQTSIATSRWSQIPRLNLYASTEKVAEDDEDEIPDNYEEAVEVQEIPEKKINTETPFSELGFFGKLYRGTKNTVIVTGLSFAGGTSFGLLAGGVRGFPNMMTRSEGGLGTPFFRKEVPLRWKRYSGKMYRWASYWGPAVGVFGCTFSTSMYTLRGGEFDLFSFCLSYSAAAVYHNRHKSLQRKAIVAVGYSCLAAALSYGFEYATTEPVRRREEDRKLRELGLDPEKFRGRDTVKIFKDGKVQEIQIREPKK